MKKFKTEQEKFWAGDFGADYIKRNAYNGKFLASQVVYFSKVLARTRGVKSVMEFGPNVGVNLRAVKSLIPEAELSAVEINPLAVAELKKWKEGKVKIYHQSILDFKTDHQRDFVFTRGVLIHINPDELAKVYRLLYNTSKCYICIGEYYNPSPVSVEYRKERDRLFKRDFCGEMMDRYKDLKLIDYGFTYHRDPNFPQDDINWFLLEKK